MLLWFLVDDEVATVAEASHRRSQALGWRQAVPLLPLNPAQVLSGRVQKPWLRRTQAEPGLNPAASQSVSLPQTRQLISGLKFETSAQ